jgi:molybdopterin converting factor small subunit
MSATVKVLYFGAATEMTGRAEEEIAADETTALRRKILERYPAMNGLTFRMALNRVLLKEEALLKENDIVAILPPFEGG